jgi:hypothetical protein
MSGSNTTPASPACDVCGFGCGADATANLDGAPVSSRALFQVVLVLFGIPLAVLIVAIWSVPEALPIGIRATVVLLVIGLTLGLTSRSGDRLADLVAASPNIR